MRSIATMALLAAALLGNAAQAQTKPSLDLADFGSFHVGGRVYEVSGQPVKEVLFTPGGAPAKIDPNGKYLVEQMYVQYFTPAKLHAKLPILLWHGGGLTGVTYETTPDGREGWLHYFIRHGWKTYVSDAVERGRSGWAPPGVWQGEPQFLPEENPWNRFRIGEGPWNDDAAKRVQYPGSQFPAEGYINFMKQNVPRWTTTDDAIIRGYIALVEKVCPCVVLVHSQAGQFGQKVAQARPDLVKALVLVEPAGLGDPNKAEALKGMPILTVFGDNIERDSRWPSIRANQMALNAKYVAAGASVDQIDLPKVGITGNSHMMMMDRNNMQVADLIQDWLKKKGFAE